MAACSRQRCAPSKRIENPPPRDGGPRGISLRADFNDPQCKATCVVGELARFEVVCSRRAAAPRDRDHRARPDLRYTDQVNGIPEVDGAWSAGCASASLSRCRAPARPIRLDTTSAKVHRDLPKPTRHLAKF